MRKILFILLLCGKISLSQGIQKDTTYIVYGQKASLFLDSIRATQWVKDTIALYNQSFSSACITDSLFDSLTMVNDTLINYENPMYEMPTTNLTNKAFLYILQVVQSMPQYTWFKEENVWIMYKKKQPF